MSDKEKLVELIQNYVGGCARYWTEMIADGLIANGVTVQENSKPVDFDRFNKWISVEERLPEDDLPNDTNRRMIRCLVYTNKGTVKPCVRQRWEHFDGTLIPWMWNKDYYAKPTHWMPLPEPPKGE